MSWSRLATESPDRLRVTGVRAGLAGALVALALALGPGPRPGYPPVEDATVVVSHASCGPPSRGLGVVVEDERVLTAAHVVAGAATVDIGGRPGRVVAFDPGRDLAVVEVPGLDRAAVAVASSSLSDDGLLVSISTTGDVVRRPAGLRRPIRATGEDIYAEPGPGRAAYELQVEIEPGWSGSGIYRSDGALQGLVFAQSRNRAGVTYAVAESEIADFLAAVASGELDEPGPCL